MWKKIKPYVISIIIALAVGGLSALFTRNDMDLYSEVIRPPLAPPAILFPIAWTILYILMGISAAIIFVSRKNSLNVSNALTLYVANLIFNFFWSIIFFKFRAFLVSFIWLVILWTIIFKMIVAFKPINKTAAYLQIPYILWVTFAGYLNLAIYILN